MHEIQRGLIKKYTYFKINSMKFVEVEVVPIQSEQIILAACTDRVKTDSLWTQKQIHKYRPERNIHLYG